MIILDDLKSTELEQIHIDGLTNIPLIKGDKGDKGETGPANNLIIGTVESGEKANASITGKAPKQVLNLVLPRGEKGVQGDPGNKGDPGEIGPSNVLTIGSVSSGQKAEVTITGKAPKQVLNFVLPKGDKGETGSEGPPGKQGEQGRDGIGIPTGGITGQVLVKKSNSDYDTEWISQNEFTLKANNDGTVWNKVAEITTEIGNTPSNVMLSISGNCNCSNSAIGIDLLQASTRGNKSNLRIKNILKEEWTPFLYGYVTNIQTGKSEIWVKRDIYSIDATIEILANTNGVVGNLLEQTSEPEGIIYVDRDIEATLLNIYPVGSIYISVNDINPRELFGGTWELWGAGRVPVCVDVTQEEFNSAEKIGGEKKHTLTVEEMPSHQHELTNNTMINRNLPGENGGQGSNAVIASTIECSDAGGDQEHNNLQPYITCYMYKRIA